MQIFPAIMTEYWPEIWTSLFLPPDIWVLRAWGKSIVLLGMIMFKLPTVCLKLKHLPIQWTKKHFVLWRNSLDPLLIQFSLKTAKSISSKVLNTPGIFYLIWILWENAWSSFFFFFILICQMSLSIVPYWNISKRIKLFLLFESLLSKT